MVAPAAGAVVLVTFPFSDLSSSKLRPAVVVANAARGDWILAQVTSNPFGDSHAIRIVTADFATGSLQRESFARPGKLFTAHSRLMAMQVGVLQDGTFRRLVDAIVAVIRSGLPGPSIGTVAS